MIRVRTNPEQIATYHRLLTSDWNSHLTDEVLQLLWSTISGRQVPGDAGLFVLLDPQSNGEFSTAGFAAIFCPANWRGGENFIVPRRVTGNAAHVRSPASCLSKIVRQSIQLVDLSNAPGTRHRFWRRGFSHGRSIARLSGRDSFRATEFGGIDIPLEYLFCCTRPHCFQGEYLAYDQSHFCYMTSMVHDYLGNVDQRLRLLHDSFRLTPRDDHSFLTKAQEYWTELLDHGRRTEAEEFLFSLRSQCSTSQRDEVRQMIAAAFEYRSAGEQSGVG